MNSSPSLIGGEKALLVMTPSKSLQARWKQLEEQQQQQLKGGRSRMIILRDDSTIQKDVDESLKWGMSSLVECVQVRVSSSVLFVREVLTCILTSSLLPAIAKKIHIMLEEPQAAFELSFSLSTLTVKLLSDFSDALLQMLSTLIELLSSAHSQQNQRMTFKVPQEMEIIYTGALFNHHLHNLFIHSLSKLAALKFSPKRFVFIINMTENKSLASSSSTHLTFLKSLSEFIRSTVAESGKTSSVKNISIFSSQQLTQEEILVLLHNSNVPKHFDYLVFAPNLTFFVVSCNQQMSLQCKHGNNSVMQMTTFWQTFLPHLPSFKSFSIISADLLSLSKLLPRCLKALPDAKNQHRNISIEFSCPEVKLQFDQELQEAIIELSNIPEFISNNTSEKSSLIMSFVSFVRPQTKQLVLRLHDISFQKKHALVFTQLIELAKQGLTLELSCNTSLTSSLIESLVKKLPQQYLVITYTSQPKSSKLLLISSSLQRVPEHQIGQFRRVLFDQFIRNNSSGDMNELSHYLKNILQKKQKCFNFLHVSNEECSQFLALYDQLVPLDAARCPASESFKLNETTGELVLNSNPELEGLLEAMKSRIASRLGCMRSATVVMPSPSTSVKCAKVISNLLMRLAQKECSLTSFSLHIRSSCSDEATLEVLRAACRIAARNRDTLKRLSLTNEGGILPAMFSTHAQIFKSLIVTQSLNLDTLELENKHVDMLRSFPELLQGAMRNFHQMKTRVKFRNLFIESTSGTNITLIFNIVEVAYLNTSSRDNTSEREEKKPCHGEGKITSSEQLSSQEKSYPQIQVPFFKEFGKLISIAHAVNESSNMFKEIQLRISVTHLISSLDFLERFARTTSKIELIIEDFQILRSNDKILLISALRGFFNNASILLVSHLIVKFRFQRIGSYDDVLCVETKETSMTQSLEFHINRITPSSSQCVRTFLELLRVCVEFFGVLLRHRSTGQQSIKVNLTFDAIHENMEDFATVDTLLKLIIEHQTSIVQATLFSIKVINKHPQLNDFFSHLSAVQQLLLAQTSQNKKMVIILKAMKDSVRGKNAFRDDFIWNALQLGIFGIKSANSQLSKTCRSQRRLTAFK